MIVAVELVTLQQLFVAKQHYYSERYPSLVMLVQSVIVKLDLLLVLLEQMIVHIKQQYSQLLK